MIRVSIMPRCSCSATSQICILPRRRGQGARRQAWARLHQLAPRAQIYSPPRGCRRADARPEGFSPRPYRRDRRSLNFSLPTEYARARAWLDGLGPPPMSPSFPAITTPMFRQRRNGRPILGRIHARRRRRGERTFPFLRRRGEVALIALSSAVPTAPFMATGSARRAAARRASPRRSRKPRSVPRRAHPSPAARARSAAICGGSLTARSFAACSPPTAPNSCSTATTTAIRSSGLTARAGAIPVARRSVGLGAHAARRRRRRRL